MTADTAEAIDGATRELLVEIERRNQLDASEVVSAFFSVTSDITAHFPATAAREMGWDAPMLDLQHMDVPGALRCCVRALIHVDREGPVVHVYLRGARSLRPDLEDAP